MFTTSHDEPNPGEVTDEEAGYGPADGPEVPWAQQGDPYLGGVPAPEQAEGARVPWYDRLG
ncbi:MAG TPA: hypothetical protein VKI00_24775 [Mycobacterium sp.]|uniref:hypothetical protein n=1 Tax=Mycobacterium sp. TaxID=1785 RepID=UPI002BECA637|nr:hypothetical protein [Mycobacterium sp.]HME78748.1 hypothetical protein [Mycobacterium sp.]